MGVGGVGLMMGLLASTRGEDAKVRRRGEARRVPVRRRRASPSPKTSSTTHGPRAAREGHEAAAMHSYSLARQ